FWFARMRPTSPRSNNVRCGMNRTFPDGPSSSSSPQNGAHRTGGIFAFPSLLPRTIMYEPPYGPSLFNPSDLAAPHARHFFVRDLIARTASTGICHSGYSCHQGSLAFTFPIASTLRRGSFSPHSFSISLTSDCARRNQSLSPSPTLAKRPHL